MRHIRRTALALSLAICLFVAWFLSPQGHRFWLHQLSFPALLSFTLRHKNDSDAFIELAARMDAQGHYEEAVQDYLYATQLRPSSETAWLGAIESAKRIPDLTKALSIARKMTQALPQSSNAWNALANIYLQFGDKTNAVAAGRKAVSLNPRNAAAQYNLSKAYTQRNDWQNALIAAQAAVDLAPNKIVYLLNLASILVQNGQTLQAQQTIQRAAQLAPSNPEVLAAEGELLATTATSHQQQQKAVQLLQEASNKLKDPIKLYSAYYQLGQLYLLMNKLPAAQNAFQQALQVNPTDTQTLFALGRTLALEGHTAESKAILARFYTESQFRLKLSQLQMRIARQPNNASLWTSLAQLYAQHHDWPDALQTASQSLHLQPHQPALQKQMKLWISKSSTP